MSTRGDRSPHKYQPMRRGVAGYKGVATDAQDDPTRVFPVAPITVAPGAEGEVLESKSGAWEPEPPSGPGGGLSGEDHDARDHAPTYPVWFEKTGADAGSVSLEVETVDGAASAGRGALATGSGGAGAGTEATTEGDGDAAASTQVQAGGAGNAVADVIASSASGNVTANREATTEGAGEAQARTIASSDAGAADANVTVTAADQASAVTGVTSTGDGNASAGLSAAAQGSGNAEAWHRADAAGVGEAKANSEAYGTDGGAVARNIASAGGSGEAWSAVEASAGDGDALSTVTATTNAGVAKSEMVAQFDTTLSRIQARVAADDTPQILLPDLVTADPDTPDELWNDGGLLRIGPRAPAYFSGARVLRTTVQAVADDTETLVAFETETEGWDTDAYWDAGAPGRFTIPVSGRYRLTAQVQWAFDADGIRLIQFRKNGAAGRVIGKDQARVVGVAAQQTTQQVTTVATLAAADFVELYGRHGAGATLNIEASGSHDLTWMAIERLS